MIELSDGSQRPLNIEGRDTPDWQLIDLGRFVFHFFTPEARRLYNLEDLWSGVSAPSDNNIE
jgi:ribosome-associated protein